MVIDGKHYPANDGLPRPDVVGHFKNHGVPGSYLASGFMCTIPGGLVGKGVHVIRVHVIIGDGMAYYETASVTVEGK